MHCIQCRRRGADQRVIHCCVCFRSCAPSLSCLCPDTFPCLLSSSHLMYFGRLFALTRCRCCRCLHNSPKPLIFPLIFHTPFLPASNYFCTDAWLPLHFQEKQPRPTTSLAYPQVSQGNTQNCSQRPCCNQACPTCGLVRYVTLSTSHVEKLNCFCFENMHARSLKNDQQQMTTKISDANPLFELENARPCNDVRR